jgi:hypothetical protein
VQAELRIGLGSGLPDSVQRFARIARREAAKLIVDAAPRPDEHLPAPDQRAEPIQWPRRRAADLDTSEVVDAAVAGGMDLARGGANS